MSRAPNPGSTNAKQGADPGFPIGGGTNPREGGATYNFAKLFEKLHEIEKIFGPWGGALGGCPLGSVNAKGEQSLLLFMQWIRKHA